jgi:hypothetical protein
MRARPFIGTTGSDTCRMSDTVQGGQLPVALLSLPGASTRCSRRADTRARNGKPIERWGRKVTGLQVRQDPWQRDRRMSTERRPTDR